MIQRTISHLALENGHHILHEALGDAILNLVHSAVLCPLQVRFVNVTVGVADGRANGLVGQLHALHQGNCLWSNSQEEFLDCFHDQLVVSDMVCEVS